MALLRKVFESISSLILTLLLYFYYIDIFEKWILHRQNTFCEPLLHYIQIKHDIIEVSKQMPLMLLNWTANSARAFHRCIANRLTMPFSRNSSDDKLMNRCDWNKHFISCLVIYAILSLRVVLISLNSFIAITYWWMICGVSRNMWAICRFRIEHLKIIW